MIDEKILIDLAKDRNYETLDKYIGNAGQKTKIDVVKELFKDNDIYSFLIGEEYYKKFGLNEKLKVNEDAISKLIIAGKYDSVDWARENLEYDMNMALGKALNEMMDDYKMFKKSSSLINSITSVLAGSCLALSAVALYNTIFEVRPLELTYGVIGTIFGITVFSTKHNPIKENYSKRIKEIKERYSNYFKVAIEELDKEKRKYIRKLI